MKKIPIKKYIAFTVTLATMMCGFSACKNEVASDASDSGRLKIVTTIFPEYDWVNNILGDNPANADVELLTGGVDLHSYQPTAEDILKISTCDLFIYVGGESDDWVEDALSEAVNENMQTVNLLELLGDEVKEEEVVEGMEDADDDADAEPEYDEHVWLSLSNATVLVDGISSAIETIDSDHAEEYRKNADDYMKKLSGLDAEYRSAVDVAKVTTLLFGDRFPFRYLADDYGLDYYAAFSGCSAETEAGFDTIVFLAGKVDELSLKTILTIERSDGKLAETIRANTAGKDQKILVMDSLQSVTQKDIEGGISYLSVMEDNLEVLKEALK